MVRRILAELRPLHPLGMDLAGAGSRSRIVVHILVVVVDRILVDHSLAVVVGHIAEDSSLMAARTFVDCA